MLILTLHLILNLFIAIDASIIFYSTSKFKTIVILEKKFTQKLVSHFLSDPHTAS